MIELELAEFVQAVVKVPVWAIGAAALVCGLVALLVFIDEISA